MKVTVDKDTCTGCGLCSDTCPEVFEIDDSDSVVKVKVAEVPQDVVKTCQEAADNCPVECIKIEE